MGEESLTSISDHHGPITKRPELPPQSFCSIVFQLVALQVLVLGNTFTLEQRMQLSETGGGLGAGGSVGGSQMGGTPSGMQTLWSRIVII